MKIEFDEEELQNWAINQIKKRMGDRINTLMSEWDWERYMRDAVDIVVSEKVTEVTIKTLMKDISKDTIVKTVSESIATEISDNFRY